MMDMRTTLQPPVMPVFETTFTPEPVSSLDMESDFASDAAFAAREAARVAEREALFDRLNPRQQEAVNLGPVSTLILAGAGSGKTSVLTARVARLVATGTPSREILAVTFTNKASGEMRARLSKLMDRRTVQNLMAGTFHSLCNKILRENFEAAGLPKSFAILDVDGQESICRGALKDLGLTKSAVKASAKAKASASNDPLDKAGALGEKDVVDDSGEAHEFVTPSQCAKYISSRKEAGQSPIRGGAITTMSTKEEQMEAVYAMYEERTAKSGLLDFQDLLTRTVSMLETNEDVRNSYRERFSAILVDEFQDTNDIQYRWLELLKGKKTHVMAVGDDYQSIYAFRGANPKNMFRFLKEMATDEQAPEGRIVKLEQNYRSLPYILEAANTIIAKNAGQMEKTLFSAQPDNGERIDLVSYQNGMFEAASVARKVHQMVRDNGVQPAEIALLYRTNMQSRLLEQELNKLGVPLTVYGGFRFYERQEVKMILAYLDLITDMVRDLSFVRVANFPPRGIGETTIEGLRQQAKAEGVSMMEMVGKRNEMRLSDPSSAGNAAAQKKQRQLEEFAQIILDLSDYALDQPLHKVIEKLLETSGITAHYLEEAEGSKASSDEARERIGNIEELVSAARQFELDNPDLITGADQLPEYMAYVALMTSTSESDMSRKNTVSLMTVHSSKGLEFDHVFISGLEETIFPHSRAIQEDAENGNGASFEEAYAMLGLDPSDAEYTNEEPELVDGDGIQEERRLMYVAVTRARKTLSLSYAAERMVNGEIKMYEPSRFLAEIPSIRLNHIVDAEASAAPKKKWGANLSNREYGGDAFDEGRIEYKPVAARPVARSVELSAPSSGAQKIAIIGTAGRDKTKTMSRALWAAMLNDARSRVNFSDTLVSGGAAWADHLAVRLYLDGDVQGLHLYLPAPLQNGAFLGEDRNSSGSAANYYHGLFKRITGEDGLAQLAEAIDRGAVVSYEPATPGYGAMKTRNAKVAATCNAVIAYTFSDNDEPADGGTKHTWDLVSNDVCKVHVDMGALMSVDHAPIMEPKEVPAAPKVQAHPPPVRDTSSPKPWDRPWLRRSTGAVTVNPYSDQAQSEMTHAARFNKVG
jgi:DNA helicase-2/ATP-dependent DNA helicase PcrA